MPPVLAYMSYHAWRGRATSSVCSGQSILGSCHQTTSHACIGPLHSAALDFSAAPAPQTALSLQACRPDPGNTLLISKSLTLSASQCCSEGTLPWEVGSRRVSWAGFARLWVSAVLAGCCLQRTLCCQWQTSMEAAIQKPCFTTSGVQGTCRQLHCRALLLLTPSH